MRRAIYGAFWIVIYLLLVLAPLFVTLITSTPAGRTFWRELSVALGFTGLAMMGLQFILSARYRVITRWYGIDVVYHFHRQISLVASVLVLAHPVIIFVTTPALLAWLNPLAAPWSARAGLAALLALILLVVASIFRLDLRIRYEPWRLSHGILATLAVGLAMTHIVLVGYYVAGPWKQALWIGLGVAWVASLAYIRIVKPLMMIRRPYTIVEVREERGDSWTVALQPDGHKGFRYRPGQFAWLTVWKSPFSIREHPFSFSSSALVDGRVELTIKELGDFTSAVKELKPGTRAYLDGPYGTFSPDLHEAPGYVFVAGGVGITPIAGILRTLADRHDRRPLLLVYGSRTWEDVTFREALEELERRLNLRVVHVIEEPPEDWDGESGYVTPQLLARHLPAERLQYRYFICGPDVMMDVVEEALDRLGLPEDRFHMERFNFV